MAHEFIRPNGITSNWNAPYPQMNAAFSKQALSILICQQPWTSSTLVKIRQTISVHHRIQLPIVDKEPGDPSFFVAITTADDVLLAFWYIGFPDINPKRWVTDTVDGRKSLNELAVTSGWSPMFFWLLRHPLNSGAKASRLPTRLYHCFLFSFQVRLALGPTLLSNPLLCVHPHQHYLMWAYFQKH